MYDMIVRPELVGRSFGGFPLFNFYITDVRGKQRLVAAPNKPMRRLHHAFGTYLRELVHATGKDGWGIRMLPSATGCVPGSNPIANALRHENGQCFYITDLRNAYPSVDLARLARLITFLIGYDDYRDYYSLDRFAEDYRAEAIADEPMYHKVHQFLQHHFAGQNEQGLAIGGPLSPYLMNLYCEVFIDEGLRRLCEQRELTYTRYVDDLVFSSAGFIGRGTREKIHNILALGGFSINQGKSFIRLHTMGQVQITKWGLERRDPDKPPRLVYPQRKRRKLHGIIHSYLNFAQTGFDWPEKVSGYVAEFLHYYKTARRRGQLTATDRKTMALCRQFREEWDRYGGPNAMALRRRH